jgi:hypothetical protein
MKKYFCYKYKINDKLIQEKTKEMARKALVVNRIEKGKKYFCYTIGISLASMYIVYLMKASGLMKKLEIDEKYKRRQKQIEEKHNIDINSNDKKIKEFEEKWEINKALNDYEDRLKYGNRELNKKEDVNEITEAKLSSSVNNNNNNNIENKTYEVIKEGDYEQLKVYEGGSENNQDPTQIGHTVIFDSRLNRRNKNI